ncbi:MAG: hypothetical protein FJ134_17220 [Deltaproteobacteria bacterium]|nr:hypothetical protein [Deltaproteobacteria bacterium]
MKDKDSLVSLIKSVADKAVAGSEAEGIDTEAIKKRIAKIVAEDSDILAELESLADNGEPPRKLGFIQKNTRQIITLSLTGVFIILMLAPLLPFSTLVWWAETKAYLDDVRPIFLAIYGPIIGFWFGEKTALKIPGKTQ